ncbi:MAG: hypothetical protein AAFO04_16085 [Cyanobacteria bacterium J06592_8]
MSQSQSNSQNSENLQDTQNTNLQNSSGLEVVSIGYGDNSSSVNQTHLYRDQLDQVADNINAGVDKDQSKWKSDQNWNDTSWKVWLD